jgi:hypothetical protein
VKIRNSVFAVTLSLAAIAATAQTSRLQATPAAASAPTAIPALVPYSGTAIAADGKPLTGEASITFLIFKEEAGGEPLWTETQSAVIDSTGRFKVQLGAANPNGLPPDLFANGEARWLEVQIAGEAAQARVLLASVPYALKAGDATTLGGLPVSAFALAASASAARATIGEPAGIPTDTLSNVTTVGGVSGYVPVFTGASTIADSLLFASSTGVGIGDTPASSDALDVNGKSIFRNNMSLARNGNASTSAGANSFPIVFNTMTYNSSSKAYTFPFFYFQAEASGNNTASPGATMNFLYNANSSTPAETGLYFNANGTIHFAAGQTFGATSSSGVAFNGTSTSGTGVEGTSAEGYGIQASSTSGIGIVASSTSGIGIEASSSTGSAIYGNSTSYFGVYGHSTSYPGVYGNSTSNSGVEGQSVNGDGGDFYGETSGSGVMGKSASGNGLLGVAGSRNTQGFSGIAGVWGDAAAHVGVLGTSNQYAGVQGASGSSDGVYGQSNDTNTGDDVAGVYGFASSGLPGVEGTNTISDGQGTAYGPGVLGIAGERYNPGSPNAPFVAGVVGSSSAYDGVSGISSSSSRSGVAGYSFGGTGISAYSEIGAGLFAGTGNFNGADAGDFYGNVLVTGVVSSTSEEAVIDHPLDPANKYLAHAAVQSSEIMNLYTGNITTDELGLATVTLPDWFESLNTDFRYQLTVVGQFAQAIIKNKIANGKFTIMTNASHVEVSWQVTAVRQDAYALANPLVVERQKSAKERGFYLHPEVYGQPREKGTQWASHPEIMHRTQVIRDAHKAAAK